MGIKLPGANFNESISRLRFNVCADHGRKVCSQCRADHKTSVHQHSYCSTRDLIGSMTDQYFEYDVLCHLLASIIALMVRSYEKAPWFGNDSVKTAQKLYVAKNPTAFQLFELLEANVRQYLCFPTVRTVMVLDNRQRSFAPRISVAQKRCARKAPVGQIPSYAVDMDTMLIKDTQRISVDHIVAGNHPLREFLMTRLSQKYGVICVSDSVVIGGSCAERTALKEIYNSCSEGDIMLVRLACSEPGSVMYGKRIAIHTVDCDMLALTSGVLPESKYAVWVRPIPKKKRDPDCENYDAAVVDLNQWAWRVHHTGENPLQRFFITLFYRNTDYGNPLELGTVGCKAWDALYVTDFVYFKDAARQTVVLDRNELARVVIRYSEFGPLLLEQLYRSLFMLLYYIGFCVDAAAFGWLADGSYKLPIDGLFDAYMLSFTSSKVSLVYFHRDG